MQAPVPEPRIQPLLGMPGQGLPGSFQHEPYRPLPPNQSDLMPALGSHVQAEQPMLFDRSLGGAGLQSYNSSDGSGKFSNMTSLPAFRQILLVKACDKEM